MSNTFIENNIPENEDIPEEDGISERPASPDQLDRLASQLLTSLDKSFNKKNSNDKIKDIYNKLKELGLNQDADKSTTKRVLAGINNIKDYFYPDSVEDTTEPAARNNTGKMAAYIQEDEINTCIKQINQIIDNKNHAPKTITLTGNKAERKTVLFSGQLQNNISAVKSSNTQAHLTKKKTR